MWTPLFFSLVLILGMVFGFNLRDSLRNKRDIATIVQRNDRLEEIIDLIGEKYVDTVNSNLLYNDAVNGILKSLDPHTLYIPADELQGINEELEGSFSGIGVEFSIVRDTIQVTGVIDNGPAAKAGVEVGDQLINVGDSIVAGTQITSARIMHLLRGKQRSIVKVTMKGSETGMLKKVAITRDLIPTYSIVTSIMLDSVTGFIKINRFSATTYDEFTVALSKLKKEGAKQLVLDLRDNPGGYLSAATSISDDFLAGQKLIVYTKGVHNAKTEYKSGDKDAFEKGRLVVLVDEGSASASEIVAGAVQDWDRGVVIGRRTFGKGLVQEQYEMPDGSAIRLTVSRYYTPSGRSIQRSFAKGRDAYQEDFRQRYESGELTGLEDTALADTMRYFTGTHRVVYAGGGIKPDVYVPYDTTRVSGLLLNMIIGEDLRTAIWDYFVRNKAKLKYNNIADFTRSFADQDAVTARYLASLAPEVRKAATKELAKPANAFYFTQQIKAQIARYLFRDNGYYSISLKDDAAVTRALGIMNSAEYLRLINGK